MRRLSGALGALLLFSAPALAQTGAVVGSAGPGRAGTLLREVLARPHVLLRGDTLVTLPRDTLVGTTIVRLGGDLALAARVDGDVVVVGGDLFLRPGADVRGRAVAITGGVYASTLARVHGATLAFRADSFAVTGDGDRLRLDWVPVDAPLPRVELPAFGGLRLPAYTRVDGLVLAFGPLLRAGRGRLAVEPLVTYRTHVGVVDPSVEAVLSGPGERGALRLSVGRGTFTNDAWARHEIVNTAATLVEGSDARNYFRARRASLEGGYEWDLGAWRLEPVAGVLWERASSVGSAVPPRSAPWTLLDRDDTLGIRRPNPAVEEGTIVAATGRLGFAWRPGRPAAGARMRSSAFGSLSLEVPFRAPGDARFAQAVLDAELVLPMVRDHVLWTAVHALATVGDAAPAQRWQALGGGPTLPTLEAPVLSGDRLFYVATRYVVPLHRPALPLVGAPALALRHAVGSAGVGELPELVQNVGVELTLSLLRLGVVVDPAEREPRLEVGASLQP